MPHLSRKFLLIAALLSAIGALNARNPYQSNRCTDCPRDSRGRIRRSPEARRAFERANPCPSTGRRRGRCPGYVIDHVIPLKRGGADAPSNMQWQTKAEAKAKDKWE